MESPGTSVHQLLATSLTKSESVVEGAKVNEVSLPETRNPKAFVGNLVDTVSKPTGPAMAANARVSADSSCMLGKRQAHLRSSVPAIQDEAGIRSVRTRAASDTFQHYSGGGVVLSEMGSTFFYNQDVDTSSDTGYVRRKRVRQQQLPESQWYDRGTEQNAKTCVASAGIQISTQPDVFPVGEGSTSIVNKGRMLLAEPTKVRD